ncbi:hypothetical protein LOAG_01059 [Loa loa]|uniref:Uncharacterized protein n=1 Tax=Loa loa TaxID=7209 RepID=A0A1S0U9V0_LOALO|nr:hypothetical protein LOAG_01059 [Loa loa]EFO27423.2 hypothetical protein LOAG_01059 [Loa loa]
MRGRGRRRGRRKGQGSAEEGVRSGVGEGNVSTAGKPGNLILGCQPPLPQIIRLRPTIQCPSVLS